MNLKKILSNSSRIFDSELKELEHVKEGNDDFYLVKKGKGDVYLLQHFTNNKLSTQSSKNFANDYVARVQFDFWLESLGIF